ncbi:MAG: hypothetical protein HC855_05790 [Rhizobiales bacterium]|nr:hypothetical protein [Hyphomicrobiales bacterium]
MHVIATAIGLLLLLFGGGCTLMFLHSALTDTRSFLIDLGLMMWIWVPFGLLPSVVGWFLFRYGRWRSEENRALTSRSTDDTHGGENSA